MQLLGGETDATHGREDDDDATEPTCIMLPLGLSQTNERLSPDTRVFSHETHLCVIGQRDVAGGMAMTTTDYYRDRDVSIQRAGQELFKRQVQLQTLKSLLRLNGHWSGL